MQRILWIWFLACMAAVGQSPTSARVVFYRPKNAVVSTRLLDSGPVFVDGRELAVKLKGDEFYGLEIAPGRHTFRAGDKRMPLVLDLEAGKTYYLRQQIRSGPVFPKSYFEQIAPETGASQVKLMHFHDLEKPGRDQAKF